ncbi:gliding motility-associated C-terminal domain-containing protein [Chitinophaga lutea]|uniref:Gliding motility-associated C-terminal domain-containing protein n=1 Tax=Chitinophaga lutea TaxID=2488634 RepID=A0A3N4QNY8_9BACT|nr:gliding motility-associated C-terminal domain-containing protein [Chitinophaga lutea]RPE13394.1 gliding motility-associated C-terminal domain-containing protein [Chitinophaga lutea]
MSPQYWWYPDHHENKTAPQYPYGYSPLTAPLSDYSVQAFAPGAIAARGVSAQPVNALLCIGCTLTNPTFSYDTDPNTATVVSKGIGIAADYGQRINFAGTYEAGDSVLIDFEIPSATLSLDLLQAVNVTFRNNGTAVSTVSLGSIVNLRLLGAGVGASGKRRAAIVVPGQMNSVDITQGGLITALGALHIYDVRMVVPVVVTPSPAVTPYGSTATMNASIRATSPVFNWYTSPTGGTPVFTGSAYTTPPLTRSTTYYVDATADGVTSFERQAVNVNLAGGPGPLWTYGDRQEGPIVEGLLCVACGITDAANASDGNPATSSLISMGVGAAGSVSQLIHFPGTYQAGDSIAFDIELPNQLISATALGGITVQTYSGNTPNGDAITLANDVVRLEALGLGVGSSGKFRVTIPATTGFDGVSIGTGGVLAGLGGLRVYEAAAFMPVTVTPPAPVITNGSTATMTASVRAPGAAYQWFDAPTGGTPLGTSASFTTPPLSRSDVYYVQASTPDGKTSFVRTAVPVTVSGGPGPLWTYGDQQQSPLISGICVGCSVNNPNNAIDEDTTTASTLSMTVGALGSVGQLIKFPGTYQAGDSIAFTLGVPATLINAALLSGISVQTYNGATPNPDQRTLDNALVDLQLLGLDPTGTVGKFRVVVPVNSTFDGVRVDLNGTVSALSSLNIYEAAAFIPVTVTPSNPTVPFGSDTTLTASIRLPNATFNWYTTPTGGTPIATGATFNTPVLVQGTTFYVEAATPDGLTSYIRTAVPVAVSVGPNSPNLDCGAGTTQTNAITGVCALCAVNNPALAVDQNPQTASNLHLPVALLGGTVWQRIAFANESAPGDSLRVVVGSTTGLLNLSLLGNVTLRPRNNGVENTADVRALNNGLLNLQLLDGGARASITYAPAAVFDEVEINITGLATALTQVDVYYAQQITAMAAVVADTVNVCTGQTATLTATAPASATFNWYDAPTGGNLLFTGPSYTTGAITADAVYYVEAVSAGTQCKSEVRKPVFVKVGLAAVSVTASSVTISKGQTATFNVNTPDPALTYKWYSVPTGGTPLFTGPSFTTPPLDATTTYYVEASTSTGCASAQRVQVIANVLIDNPDVPCDYANTQESATNGLLCIGCYVENQASAVDASTTTFSTVHVIAGLLGGYVQQTLIFPSASDAGDSVKLALSFPASLADVGLLGSIQIATYNGATFNNDRVALNNALLNLQLLPGNQQAVVTFAPAAVFDRVEVRMNSGVATALSAVNIHYAQRFVPVPDLQPDTVTTCVGGTATFNVAPRANTTFRWYSTPSGGTPLATGATFQSGTITADTAFYVEAAKTSINCANPVRTKAVVQIGAAPAAPTVDNSTVTTCGGTSAVLKATGPAGATFRWYDQQTGGTVLFTGDTFTTPVLNSSVVYYAEAVSSGGCASATRTAVQVNITARPGTPVITPTDATICSGSTATLTASSTTPGVVFNWYSSAALDNLVFTGPIFTTPALTTNTTYYVAAAAGQCTSATPATVLVTVNTTPVQPTVTTVPVSGIVEYGQTATLTASSTTPGAIYKWYLDATGGTPVFTGAVYTTQELAATTKFYVEAASPSGCASGRTEVTITVNRNVVPNCDFATSQTNQVGGVCLLCGVTNPTRAVDADTTNASTLSMPVGLLGTFVYQRLEFGSLAAAGDTVKVRFSTPTGLLDLTVLSAIQITSYNNGVSNNDSKVLNAAGLKLELLGSPNEAVALFAPGGAYDAVEIRLLGGVASVLLNVDVRYANRILASPTVTADNAVICAGGSATLTATGSASGTIRWYTTPAGGTAVHTGNVFTVSGLTANTTYYAEIMRTSTNCVNPVRTPVTLQVRQVPDAPQILKGDTAICAGSNAILIARPVDPAHSIRWFTTATGGAPVSLDSVFVTGTLSANTTYYAEAFNGTCGNVTRVPVTITVGAAPADPVPASNNVTVCTGTPATLNATSSTAGAIIRWYTVQSGGTPVFTGTQFVTPPVTATTLYYVEAVGSGGGCANAGGRVQVTVNADATPAVPVVADNAKTSCANQSVTFTIQSPVPGITYNWYNTATGGTLLFTGSSYATGPLTANAMFYVEAVGSGNCTSTTRGTASVTVVGSLNPPTVESTSVTVCRGAQATLRVTNPVAGVSYHWYDAPGGNRLFTGTTFVTGVQIAAGSFYVEAVSSTGCTSTGLTRVDVQVTDAPQVPVVAGATTICEGTAASLSIQNPVPGVVYSWYDAASGGNKLAEGTTFSPTGLTTTTIFHVEAVSGSCASASRSSVTITVNPAPPAVTVDATSKSVCIGNTATLNVVNPVAGVTYRWYDVPTGGTALSTSTVFITPALTTNKDYYVSATNSNNCSSLTRTKVSVTVGNGPAVPVAPAEVTVCKGLRPTVRVTNPRSDLQYRWYDAPINGTLLFIGEAYSTANPLTVKDTVYVEATLPGGTCASNGRAQVILIAADAPATPVLANSGAVTICSGTTATFSVQNPLTNVTYRWYDAAGNLLQDNATGTYTTGVLTANMEVFVEAVIGGGCASAGRARAVATVGVVPAAPGISASANTVCPDSTATLTAASTQAGVEFKWYTTATGGTAIFTGPVFKTPGLKAATTYYAEATMTGGCVSATRTAVTIGVYAQLPAPSVTVASRTATSITFQWNAIAGVLGYRVSTDGGATFTQPSSGLTGTTHTVTGLQPNQTISLMVMSVGATECANSAWFQGGGGTDNPAGNTIFVPNAFTPNNDGVNDILLVYGTTINTMEIRIYNQWGQLVFESRDKSRGWDGTMSGQRQPVGVYNYVLRATLQDGTTVQKRGTITIVR